MLLKEESRYTDRIFSIPLCTNKGDHISLFYSDIGPQVTDLMTIGTSGFLRTGPCPACKHALQVEFSVQNSAVVH